MVKDLKLQTPNTLFVLLSSSIGIVSDLNAASSGAHYFLETVTGKRLCTKFCSTVKENFPRTVWLGNSLLVVHQ